MVIFHSYVNVYQRVEARPFFTALTHAQLSSITTQPWRWIQTVIVPISLEFFGDSIMVCEMGIQINPPQGYKMISTKRFLMLNSCLSEELHIAGL